MMHACIVYVGTVPPMPILIIAVQPRHAIIRVISYHDMYAWFILQERALQRARGYAKAYRTTLLGYYHRRKLNAAGPLNTTVIYHEPFNSVGTLLNSLLEGAEHAYRRALPGHMLSSPRDPISKMTCIRGTASRIRTYVYGGPAGRAPG